METTPSSPAPKHSFVWRWLRRALIGLAVLVTLLAVCCTEENIRGKRAWNRFKAGWEAKGERFDLASVIPPPVPDAENFAMTPLLAPLLDYTNAPVKGRSFPRGPNQWRDTNAFQRLNDLDVLGKGGPKGDGTSWHVWSWREGKFWNLKVWQEHYRAQTNFPSAPQPQSPGEDVLLAMSKFDKEMDELRTASLRPHSRFPIHYEDNFSALLPHLAVLKKFAVVARLRALAELELGHNDAAFADVQFCLRLADTMKTEPLLISSLVRIAELEIALQPIWEGLARHRWSEAQLIELDRQLASVDLLAEYQRSIRGERNLGLEGIEMMRKAPRFMAAVLDDESGSGSGNAAFFLLTPGGWFEHNKVAIAGMYQDLLLPTVDAKTQRIDPSQMRANTLKANEMFNGFHPYRILAKLLLPALEKASEKFARMQTAVNEARIACALERYRLKRGEFPEKLDALVPDFMARVPHDIINGEPLHYRRTSDGQFVLYSVGWNMKDDGGEVAFLKSDKTGRTNGLNFLEGDWVWKSSGELSTPPKRE
ncbi:MAG: hypothetical protein HY300_09075 [Verrucomicrobia bacterium]|nr:hypothetical protein [Verrucomicrobiota bacterium]